VRYQGQDRGRKSFQHDSERRGLTMGKLYCVGGKWTINHHCKAGQQCKWIRVILLGATLSANKGLAAVQLDLWLGGKRDFKG
jgi:hypothetical protein